MLIGSRIITCHVTMEHTPSLPSGFNINGYLIQSLKQTDSLCHVYYASDADHVQYLLREFCPQGLAVRDPESGKLRYPENTDIEREVLPLKNDFEAQFRTGSLGEIPALGTLYLVYAIPGGHAAAQPASGTVVPPASRFQRDQRTLTTPGTGATPVHAGTLPPPRKRRTPPAYGFSSCSCWEAHAGPTISPGTPRKNPPLPRSRSPPKPTGKRRKTPNRKRKPPCPP